MNAVKLAKAVGMIAIVLGLILIVISLAKGDFSGTVKGMVVIGFGAIAMSCVRGKENKDG